MPIWKQENISLNALNENCKNTMAEPLGMRFTQIGTDYLQMQMPVNHNTHQPYGLLHGGASAALAETIGSVASALCIDQENEICVGLEINCNHIRGVRSGTVTATAKAFHLGASTHVWEIKITDEQNKLVCVSRLTVAILKKRESGK